MHDLSLLRRGLLLGTTAVLWGGCAVRPSLQDRHVPGRLDDDSARELALHAASLLDTPYRFGGNTPEGGFDCSGLIGYVYRRSAGLELPRTVAQLARTGRRIESPAALRAADLVFFRIGSALAHAGIFIGERRFIHAPATGGTVRMDSLDSGYWKPRFSWGRRV